MIRQIWTMVAEDFAPFNINVTTVKPDATLPFLRVVITSDHDFTAESTDKEAWGVAELDWATDSFNSYADPDDPNVVYAFMHAGDQIANIAVIATAASHEAAHAFGLNHFGSNSGTASKSSIMGESTGPGPQSERIVWFSSMDVIASEANGFGYRPDDYGNYLNVATSMTTTNAGLYVRGVIENTSDVDMFRFETGGGTVRFHLDVQPAAQFDGDEQLEYMANLDATFSLYDAAGNLITTVDNPFGPGRQIVKDVDRQHLLRRRWQSRWSGRRWSVLIAGHRGWRTSNRQFAVPNPQPFAQGPGADVQ